MEGFPGCFWLGDGDMRSYLCLRRSTERFPFSSVFIRLELVLTYFYFINLGVAVGWIDYNEL